MLNVACSVGRVWSESFDRSALALVSSDRLCNCVPVSNTGVFLRFTIHRECFVGIVR